MAGEFPSVDFYFGVADEGLLPGFSLRVLSEKPSTGDSRTYSSFQEKPRVNRKNALIRSQVCPVRHREFPNTASGDFAYVDKTEFIAELEDSWYLYSFIETPLRKETVHTNATGRLRHCGDQEL